MQPAWSGPARIVSLDFFGPVARIRLQGAAGASHRFQISSDLVEFTDSGLSQTADSHGVIEFMDCDPLPTRRFYRAVQMP